MNKSIVSTLVYAGSPFIARIIKWMSLGLFGLVEGIYRGVSTSYSRSDD